MHHGVLLFAIHLDPPGGLECLNDSLLVPHHDEIRVVAGVALRVGNASGKTIEHLAGHLRQFQVNRRRAGNGTARNHFNLGVETSIQLVVAGFIGTQKEAAGAHHTGLFACAQQERLRGIARSDAADKGAQPSLVHRVGFDEIAKSSRGSLWTRRTPQPQIQRPGRRYLDGIAGAQVETSVDPTLVGRYVEFLWSRRHILSGGESHHEKQAGKDRIGPHVKYCTLHR